MHPFVKFTVGAAAALACLTADTACAVEQSISSLKVYVYGAEEADVNSFVLADAKGTFIIDTTRNSREARKVVELAQSRGKAPEFLLITHGHPDHYLGMAELKKAFPHMRIVVANQGVKDDIIGFSTWMESVGWLEQEPQMKPKSTKHPDGFDYQKEIEVLDTPFIKLPGGEVLDVKSDYDATEAEHETTLYSRDLNALFASDLAYNKVHLWLGVGVPRASIEQWKRVLADLESQYGKKKSVVYPGHGKPGDVAIFAEDRTYMDALLKVVEESPSEEEAKARMTALYPDYRNADFLLAQSIKFQMTQVKR